MKFLKYIAIALVVIVGAYSLWMSTLDGHYDIHRTRTIKAPASVIYSYVDDYKEWPKWSPWAETFGGDMEVTYTGNEKGVGAGYYWTGEESGAGSMETVNSEPYSKIEQKIVFTEPFESKSDIYWRFVETGEGVEVTWGMKGDMSFFMRFFAAGMDDAMNADFLRGLEKLDSISVNTKRSSAYTIDGIVDFPLTTYAGVFSEKVTSQNISEQMGANYGKIITFLSSKKVKMSGAPMTIYTFYDEKTKETSFYSAIPVPKMMKGDAVNKIEIAMIKPSKMYKISYKGPYEEMEGAWIAGMEQMEKEGLEMNGNPMEVYIDDPVNVAPSELRTEIYIPIK